MWHAFSRRSKPSLMNGSNALYSSSGLWKNAQTSGFASSTEPANRIGWLLSLEVPPRDFTRLLVRSIGVLLRTGGRHVQPLTGPEGIAGNFGLHRCHAASNVHSNPYLPLASNPRTAGNGQ